MSNSTHPIAVISTKANNRRLLRNVTLIIGVLLFVSLTSACGSGEATEEPIAQVAAQEPTEKPKSPTAVLEAQSTDDGIEMELGELTIQSSAFEAGDELPVRFSCDGEDVSPPLAWDHAPEGTQSFALIMEDPDAPGGTWIHWVLYNIPAEVSGLDGGLTGGLSLPAGIESGENSWGNDSYGGACPPNGTHRYFFHLYALDTTLQGLSTPTRETLHESMEDHILAEAELMGTFSR